ncbi:MAG: ABC transporter substrate-binding protein [Termitinemataceae bacterium]|nr:MAG: ABC transporter substrate-binding protein [Termitinemataceae bacterium]
MLFSKLPNRGAAILAVLVVCFASCSSSEKKDTQEIIIGEQSDLQSFDPLDGMLDDTQILVYNALVEIDANFKQTPALAESWEMSEDGMTWTFHLRRGVTFHDGQKWDTAAALANFKRLDGYPGLADTKNVDAPDDYTLIFNMKQPTYNLSSNLARTMMSMVSPAVINPDGSITAGVGSGPYKLEKWERDVQYVFDANDDFWGGKPNIRKITFKVIPDAQARAAALESGEIDMMNGYQSLAAVKRLSNNNKFQVIKKVQNTSQFIIFNLDRSPVDNLLVREAIGHALDFTTIVNTLLPSLVSAPQGFFSPSYGDNVNPDVRNPEFDVAKAAVLLDNAGWLLAAGGLRYKEGKPLTVTLTFSAGNSEDSLLAPLIQDHLKQIGVDLKLNPVESATLDDVLENKKYDMVLTGQSFIPTDDPLFHYKNGYWHSNSYYKIYTTPKLDAMIDELASTMDIRKRVELNHNIQKNIMDNVPVLMVFHRNSVRLAKSNIADFDISSGCWHINRDLYKARIRSE